MIATESYYPNISGVAVFSHNLAKKMVERGHQVYVIAPSAKFTEHTEVVDGVKIFRLASKINRFRQGYYISRWPFAKTSKIMVQVKPDVVHLQDPAMISIGALRAARRMKIPIVVTNHFSLEYVVSYLPWLKLINPFFIRIGIRYLNWFYSKCNVLTCPTETVAKRFRQINHRLQIEAISNGVDLSRFMPYYGDSAQERNKFKIPANLPIILYVGRLDIDKRIADLVKALPEVLKHISAHLLIVGSGTEQKKLEKLIHKLGIANYVTLIGVIPYARAELPRIYQTSTVFVDPCPAETQGIVVLEAMASGLPCVVAKAGALPELIKDNENGYLFNPKKHHQLAEKITTILKDKKLTRAMGERGLEMVSAHLASNTFNRFEKIYQELNRR